MPLLWEGGPSQLACTRCIDSTFCSLIQSTLARSTHTRPCPIPPHPHDVVSPPPACTCATSSLPACPCATSSLPISCPAALVPRTASLPACPLSCRRWMRTVLQPLNEKAADIIVNNVNMLESPRLDPILLQFVAHVSAYKVCVCGGGGLVFHASAYEVCGMWGCFEEREGSSGAIKSGQERPGRERHDGQAIPSNCHSDAQLSAIPGCPAVRD